MQEYNLFEYAVIRVVPRVEREEFLNTGVIVYCAKLRFLQAMISLNEERLRAFSPDIYMPQLEAYLRAFEQVSNGGTDGGPIGQLDIASRFRWLTATRSTVLQTSKVHSGFCADPLAALIRLQALLVL
jgi:hypothetical protein